MTEAPAPGVRSEVGSLECVLVHEPGDEFSSVVDPDAWGWDGLPRLKQAAKEHEKLVQTLETHGVDVRELGETDDTLAESLFVRDVGFVVEGGAVIGQMSDRIRDGEELRLASRLVEMGTPIYHTVHGGGRFEAANLIWLDRETVAIGRSKTTNTEGIRQIRSVLDTYDIDIVEIPIFGSTNSTGQTHLALVFNMVADDLALLYPQAVPTEFRELLEDRGIDIIEVPTREQRNMVTSCIVVDDETVVLSAGNPVTRNALQHRGFEVIELDIREIKKARGGLKGLVLPLERA
ncbi:MULTISPECIES: dimethylarginine dimethylaminohydrolase family protein [Haloferax]|uniref:Amidinotransferase n=1 Tax=Haloferax marinum TaxID=2666143 RepID=A0A6A8GAX3_9EURY|nr:MULTISPECIES: arginine deiminase family protein [Haloferax]KAB1190703.1 amidinotransferase [Haloferax sp. CBA1150]MRW98234.1 amidinotransferase [Haloferax marinum]